MIKIGVGVFKEAVKIKHFKLYIVEKKKLTLTFLTLVLPWIEDKKWGEGLSCVSVERNT